MRGVWACVCTDECTRVCGDAHMHTGKHVRARALTNRCSMMRASTCSSMHGSAHTAPATANGNCNALRVAPLLIACSHKRTVGSTPKPGRSARSRATSSTRAHSLCFCFSMYSRRIAEASKETRPPSPSQFFAHRCRCRCRRCHPYCRRRRRRRRHFSHSCSSCMC